MFLKEWKSKPTISNNILLGYEGNINNDTSLITFRGNKKQDKITDMRLCIYNITTDRVSDKSVYVDNFGQAYINTKNENNENIKIYLKDFKM